LHSRAFDKVDWSAVHKDYAKEYVKAMAFEFGLKIEMESLESPKEYNFSTDRIFVTIDENEVKRIYSEVNKETLRSLIEGTLKERSGFIPFYSNDVESWPEEVTEWDHNQVGLLISAYLSDKDFDEQSLVEDFNSNGVLDELIYGHMADGKRLCDIAYYLRQRAERSYGFKPLLKEFSNELKKLD
jgi:hypothetical protein